MSTQPHNTEHSYIEGEEIELQLTPFEQIAMWLSITLARVLTVGSVCGIAGYLISRTPGV